MIHYIMQSLLYQAVKVIKTKAPTKHKTQVAFMTTQSAVKVRMPAGLPPHNINIDGKMLHCFRLSPSFPLIPFSLSCFFSFPDNLAPPLACGRVLVLGVGLGLFFGLPTTPTTADKDFERRDIPCLVFLVSGFSAAYLTHGPFADLDWARLEGYSLLR